MVGTSDIVLNHRTSKDLHIEFQYLPKSQFMLYKLRHLQNAQHLWKILESLSSTWEIIDIYLKKLPAYKTISKKQTLEKEIKQK